LQRLLKPAPAVCGRPASCVLVYSSVVRPTKSSPRSLITGLPSGSREHVPSLLGQLPHHQRLKLRKSTVGGTSKSLVGPLHRDCRASKGELAVASSLEMAKLPPPQRRLITVIHSGTLSAVPPSCPVCFTTPIFIADRRLFRASDRLPVALSLQRLCYTVRRHPT
jgi:hypothetical protein